MAKGRSEPYGELMMTSNVNADTGVHSASNRRFGRWSHPKQKMLSLLALGVIVGAFLPWLETPIGVYRGFAGPGLYLFYVGIIGLAAGLVPFRLPAIVQGGLLAIVAVALPVWQMAKLISKVGFDGWTPGVGMMMIIGCGLMAGRIVYEMATAGDAGRQSV